MLDHAARSEQGNHRSNNEDYVLEVAADHLWILADGVGGRDAGEVASQLACEVVAAEVKKGVGLEQAIQHAHRAIKQAAREGQGRPGMATTIVAMLLYNGHYQISWVGDSRAYKWTVETDLKQITHDHSLVQSLMDKGHLTPEQAAAHPSKSVLNQALGQENLDQVEVDTIEGELDDGQYLMLCSDGLSDYVGYEQIKACFSKDLPSKKIMKSLIQQTLDNDGRDNVSVIVVGDDGKPERANYATEFFSATQLSKEKWYQSWKHNKLLWLCFTIVFWLLIFSALGIVNYEF